MMTDADVSDFIANMSLAHAQMVKVGMEHAESRVRPALQCLQREFQQALLDPETKIKSSFQVAVLNVLMLLPDYAETMVKRDQLTRHEGRSDHDLDTRGNPLKAGS